MLRCHLSVDSGADQLIDLAHHTSWNLVVILTLLLISLLFLLRFGLELVQLRALPCDRLIEVRLGLLLAQVLEELLADDGALDHLLIVLEHVRGGVS